ncbi:MAG: alpha/beta fold hydrolase [Solirubrobacteraceae bacterium]
MLRSAPVDGFSLAYDRHGSGAPIVLLHGWPGDHGDWREVVFQLAGGADIVVPDLRGFGESDKHPRDPAQAYSAAAQADSVLALIDELGLGPAVLAGYDVGSRLAQQIARTRPEAVRALVVAPPLPGAGDRVLSADSQREFWYQPFHQLAIVQEIIDGRPLAVRAYLEHFWSHWSGPNFMPAAGELDRLTVLYGAPGAFLASIGWYRAGAGMIASSLAEQAPAPTARITVPTTVLWPEHDPLFPRAWGDRLDQFFTDVSVQALAGAGHFSPLEAPERFAEAIRAAAG